MAEGAKQMRWHRSGAKPHRQIGWKVLERYGDYESSARWGGILTSYSRLQNPESSDVSQSSFNVLQEILGRIRSLKSFAEG
jgi:hypothetical protein